MLSRNLLEPSLPDKVSSAGGVPAINSHLWSFIKLN